MFASPKVLLLTITSSGCVSAYTHIQKHTAPGGPPTISVHRQMHNTGARTHTHKHTNRHNCHTGSGRGKLELLSDTRGESNPGKHERSRQTSPRRLSGSYFPVTLSHTGCLSPGRRGHDTSDNSQQPPPPSTDSLSGRTSMRLGPRSFFSLR